MVVVVGVVGGDEWDDAFFFIQKPLVLDISRISKSWGSVEREAGIDRHTL